MNSETSLAALQCRLHEWAMQIKDCQNRPAEMSVVEWCARNDITKANYYYRLRRVREACLLNLQKESNPRQVIPVAAGLLMQDGNASADTAGQGLDISMKGISIHVTQTNFHGTSLRCSGGDP